MFHSTSTFIRRNSNPPRSQLLEQSAQATQRERRHLAAVVPYRPRGRAPTHSLLPERSETLVALLRLLAHPDASQSTRLVRLVREVDEALADSLDSGSLSALVGRVAAGSMSGDRLAAMQRLAAAVRHRSDWTLAQRAHMLCDFSHFAVDRECRSAVEWLAEGVPAALTAGRFGGAVDRCSAHDELSDRSLTALCAGLGRVGGHEENPSPAVQAAVTALSRFIQEISSAARAALSTFSLGSAINCFNRHYSNNRASCVSAMEALSRPVLGRSCRDWALDPLGLSMVLHGLGHATPGGDCCDAFVHLASAVTLLSERLLADSDPRSAKLPLVEPQKYKVNGLMLANMAAGLSTALNAYGKAERALQDALIAIAQIVTVQRRLEHWGPEVLTKLLHSLWHHRHTLGNEAEPALARLAAAIDRPDLRQILESDAIDLPATLRHDLPDQGDEKAPEFAATAPGDSSGRSRAPSMDEREEVMGALEEMPSSALLRDAGDHDVVDLDGPDRTLALRLYEDLLKTRLPRDHVILLAPGNIDDFERRLAAKFKDLGARFEIVRAPAQSGLLVRRVQ